MYAATARLTISYIILKTENQKLLIYYILHNIERKINKLLNEDISSIIIFIQNLVNFNYFEGYPRAFASLNIATRESKVSSPVGII